MLYLYITAIIAALFITNSTAPILGISQVVTLSLSPLLIYSVISILTNKKNIWKLQYNSNSIIIIIFGFFLLLFKISIKQDFFKNILQFIFIPMLISIAFEELKSREIRILKYFVLIFYLIECTLAIYERITLTNVFISIESAKIIDFYNQEDWSFRSTSLMGHPLANALIVTTILSFILLNKSFNLITKILITALGYISLYCFNARGAIIVSTLLILPYLFFLIKKSPKRNIRKFVYLLLIIVSVLFIFNVANSPLGGRLFNEENILDGSAQTRLEVLNFYSFLTSEQLLYGSPYLYNYLMGKLGAGGVENGVIVLIINYGIISAIILLILLINFHYKKLTVYTKGERIWIMTIFYIIGTMNPNLSSPIVWTIWLLSYYAFRNKTFKNL